MFFFIRSSLFQCDVSFGIPIEELERICNQAENVYSNDISFRNPSEKSNAKIIENSDQVCFLIYTFFKVISIIKSLKFTL